MGPLALDQWPAPGIVASRHELDRRDRQMSLGGNPKPAGPDFDALAVQRKRDREGERARAVQAADAGPKGATLTGRGRPQVMGMAVPRAAS